MPPHHRHHPHHHHGPPPSPPDPVAEELRKLVHHGRITSLAEVLAHVSRRSGAETAGKIANTLSEYGASTAEEAMPLVEAVLRLLGGEKRRRLLTDAQQKCTALVFPLPPHIHSVFLELPEVRVLVPDQHELPHHLDNIDAPVIHGTRSCRRSIRDAEIIITEGYRHDGVIIGDIDVVDVVHRDCIDPKAVVHAHLRPHQHHGDVPFTLDADRLSLL